MFFHYFGLDYAKFICGEYVVRIQKLYVQDLMSGITINDITFARLNVLVGVSGAGKTSIITALKRLVRIAEGFSDSGVSWELSFLDDDNNDVLWSGKTSRDWDINNEGDFVAPFIQEKLIVNDVEVFSSNQDGIELSGVKLPKLDDTKSLIFHLRNENKIKRIQNSISSAVIVDVDSSDFSQSQKVTFFKENLHNEISEFKSKFSIKKLSCSHKELSCREKLYYAHEYDREAFNDFQGIYTSIFPQVKSVSVKALKTYSHGSDRERAIMISLHMKNKRIVRQGQISSGMFKTMMILSELCFGNNKSPIVIDEIENSLGVNCLPDILAELNMASNQVIITSHHPRVINEIPVRHWNIVSRLEDGSVVTKKAEDVLPKGSNHEAFLQLINSPEYKGC